MKKIYVFIIFVIMAVALAAGCSSGSPQPNAAAPDFQLKTLDGSSVALSALKGRPVLLNFWATWCGPCRSEMPFLQQISRDPDWQARGLVLLAVNLEESEAVVRKFMADNGFSFTVLLDSAGEVGRLYNISSIPATFIIGKDGIIKSSRVGAFASKNQIEQALLSAVNGE